MRGSRFVRAGNFSSGPRGRPFSIGPCCRLQRTRAHRRSSAAQPVPLAVASWRLGRRGGHTPPAGACCSVDSLPTSQRKYDCLRRCRRSSGHESASHLAVASARVDLIRCDLFARTSNFWVAISSFSPSRTVLQNNPLYLQSFTEADDALKLHHIVHCSLDVIDERGSSTPQPIINDPDLESLLCSSPGLARTLLSLHLLNLHVCWHSAVVCFFSHVCSNYVSDRHW